MAAAHGPEEQTDLAAAMMDTVVSAESMDLLAEFGEVALDATLTDGILQDIPVVGTVVKLGRAAVGIRDLLFIRKLQRFLFQLRQVSSAERNAFHAQLSDNTFRVRVGENLLLILERLDHIEKPALVGKAFAAYMQGRIDYDSFTRLSAAIDRAFLPDLLALDGAQYESIGSARGQSSREHLAGCGLMEAVYTPGRIREVGYTSTDAKFSYQLSSLGDLFIAICLEQ